MTSGDRIAPSALTSPPSRLAYSIWVQLRPKQWLKNLACFAALLFSGRLSEVQAVFLAVLAFCGFCAASSFAYLINDYLDRHSDRLNPRVAHRPIASGDLSPAVAGTMAVFLLAIAFSISTWLGTACLVDISAYLVLNLLYSSVLKRIAILDAVCIAIGFVLRTTYGTHAIQVPLSAPISLCMFFLAMFLCFAKRKSEINNLGDEYHTIRPVLKDYQHEFLNILFTVSASLTIMCYAFATLATHKNPTLVLTTIPVVYCVARYILLTIDHSRGDTPEELFVSDRGLWLGTLVWAALCIAILYAEINIFARFDEWKWP
ncbi:MAG: decaprenyl-phosphate phosphoribosyltransferase [Pirellulales bacterium]